MNFLEKVTGSDITKELKAFELRAKKKNGIFALLGSNCAGREDCGSSEKAEIYRAPNKLVKEEQSNV